MTPPKPTAERELQADDQAATDTTIATKAGVDNAPKADPAKIPADTGQAPR